MKNYLIVLLSMLVVVLDVVLVIIFDNTAFRIFLSVSAVCCLFSALQFTRIEMLEAYKKLLEKLEEKETFKIDKHRSLDEAINAAYEKVKEKNNEN